MPNWSESRRIFTLALVLGAACLLPAAERAPKRIISTAPGITEILFALGLGDQVVGVTEFCKYPPQVRRLPKIGTWAQPNMEVMLSLKPDLVVVQQTAKSDISQYEAVHLNAVRVTLDSIADISKAIDTVGNAARVPRQASDLKARIRSDLDSVRASLASSRRTRVLFVVGRNPGSLDGMVAVGNGSYLSELIDLAGGTNVLADSKVAYVKPAPEELLARRPEVILDIGANSGAENMTDSQIRAQTALWNVYPTIPAVHNHRIHILTSEIFVVPGPRVTDCAREMVRLLHPELSH